MTKLSHFFSSSETVFPVVPWFHLQKQFCLPANSHQCMLICCCSFHLLLLGHRIGQHAQNCQTDVTQCPQIGTTHVLPMLIVALLGRTKEPKKQMQTSVSASTANVQAALIRCFLARKFGKSSQTNFNAFFMRG